MGRPRRVAFNFICGCSAFACIAVCALWVRSYWVADSIGTAREKEDSALCAARGLVWFCHMSVPDGTSFGAPHGLRHGRWDPYYDPADPRRWRFAGFLVWQTTPALFGGEGNTVFFETWVVQLPLWSLAVLFAITPLIWLRKRRRDFGPNHCRHCGYDLRASPNRCPECGRPCVVTRA